MTDYDGTGLFDAPITSYYNPLDTKAAGCGERAGHRYEPGPTPATYQRSSLTPTTQHRDSLRLGGDAAQSVYEAGA